MDLIRYMDEYKYILNWLIIYLRDIKNIYLISCIERDIYLF